MADNTKGEEAFLKEANISVDYFYEGYINQGGISPNDILKCYENIANYAVTKNLITQEQKDNYFKQYDEGLSMAQRDIMENVTIFYSNIGERITEPFSAENAKKQFKGYKIESFKDKLYIGISNMLSYMGNEGLAELVKKKIRIEGLCNDKINKESKSKIDALLKNTAQNIGKAAQGAVSNDTAPVLSQNQNKVQGLSK